MRKLEEKLSMTSRWATDSRHMIHTGGMYWSMCFMQVTCTSEEEKVLTLGILKAILPNLGAHPV